MRTDTLRLPKRIANKLKGELIKITEVNEGILLKTESNTITEARGLLKDMNRQKIIKTLRKTLGRDKEILFAYLYGSYAADDAYFGSDIDVAVYLKPSGMVYYMKKEEELTFALAKKLHRDDVDLRILNVLPFLMQYKVLKEGMLLVLRDELERVDFETRAMNRYFELKPYLEESDRMLTLRIEAGI